MTRRMVAAVLLDAGAGAACASVDPDLAEAAGLGVYDATMGLLHAATAGRRLREEDDAAAAGAAETLRKLREQVRAP